MIDPKYNKFILSVLLDDPSILFDTVKDTLEYAVPFGNYKVGDYISEEDWKLFLSEYDKYIEEYNIVVVNTELIDNDSESELYDYVFTYDKNYYKVQIGGTYYDWYHNPDWLDKDLKKYQVYLKAVIKVVYE